MAEKSILVLIMVMSICMFNAEASVTYNDGGIHEINSYIDGDVTVYDGPTNFTTVNMVGGAAYVLAAYDRSHVNIFP